MNRFHGGSDPARNVGSVTALRTGIKRFRQAAQAGGQGPGYHMAATAAMLAASALMPASVSNRSLARQAGPRSNDKCLGEGVPPSVTAQ